MRLLVEASLQNGTWFKSLRALFYMNTSWVKWKFLYHYGWLKNTHMISFLRSDIFITKEIYPLEGSYFLVASLYISAWKVLQIWEWSHTIFASCIDFIKAHLVKELVSLTAELLIFFNLLATHPRSRRKLWMFFFLCELRIYLHAGDTLRVTHG